MSYEEFDALHERLKAELTEEQRRRGLPIIAAVHARVLDRRQKARRQSPTFYHNRSGLSRETVLSIFEALLETNGKQQKAIAERFNIGARQVSCIWRGRNYGKITQELREAYTAELWKGLRHE